MKEGEEKGKRRKRRKRNANAKSGEGGYRCVARWEKEVSEEEEGRFFFSKVK